MTNQLDGDANRVMNDGRGIFRVLSVAKKKGKKT